MNGLCYYTQDFYLYIEMFLVMNYTREISFQRTEYSLRKSITISFCDD